ncbi:trp operon leader peptide [Streptomyces sp. A012304]|uniref:trp operon leader peptide n=1 Tax=Streptomyces sp. A012304 TaxID=375446 RepID=UPI0035D4DFE8
MTARRASGSGYSGCCAAGRSRQVLPAFALVLAFTVTHPGYGVVSRDFPVARQVRQSAAHLWTWGLWGNVRRMFAHSTQNWWWTAHPAAH